MMKKEVEMIPRRLTSVWSVTSMASSSPFLPSRSEDKRILLHRALYHDQFLSDMSNHAPMGLLNCTADDRNVLLLSLLWYVVRVDTSTKTSTLICSLGWCPCRGVKHRYHGGLDLFWLSWMALISFNWSRQCCSSHVQDSDSNLMHRNCDLTGLKNWWLRFFFWNLLHFHSYNGKEESSCSATAPIMILNKATRNNKNHVLSNTVNLHGI